MENKGVNRACEYDSINIIFAGSRDEASAGLEKPDYRILFRMDFNGIADELKALGLEGRRFMIVSDSNVAGLYLEECLDAIRPVAKYAGSFVFEAGEENKNLSTVNMCYKRLIEAGFDRNDVILALGGGVTGDLAGFAAATYLRGIRFIQLPTSLLAMVDSSIGGKTGVDYEGYKNMVGAFYQPRLVYVNLAVLDTLPGNQFISGMVEVIKHGLIKDGTYYEWLRANRDQIIAKDYDSLKEMIYKSCVIKKEVVERDPKEAGERALLNFGHTIGHSVEKLKGFALLHGECVGIGIAAASFISHKRGYLDKDGFEGILKTLADFKAPVKTSGLSVQEVYEATRLDKKMDAGKIKFILLNGIGNALIDTSVTQEELKDAINYVIG